MSKVKIAAAMALLAASIPVACPAVAGGAPAPSAALQAPAPVQALLERACYDCHSDRTHWPWYSAVAPLSWLIERDVRVGRQELNFSRWGSYYPITRRRKLEWIGRVMRRARMPPKTYLFMHPRARLSPDERAQIERWVSAALAAQPQK